MNENILTRSFFLKDFMTRKTAILKTVKNTMPEEEYQNLLSKELDD
jgi:hypothetical protein